MGLGVIGTVLILGLLFKHLASQQPNTDEFYVSEFLKKMVSNSSSFSSYNFSASVCSWQGVFCDNNKEHVVELNFSGLGLSGTIPDNTIGKLSKLQTLDLSCNKITTLPSDFWSLSSIKSLNLSTNQISGSLTNNIGNFGMLETIDLSSNNFTEEIPEAIGSLMSLRILKLDHNKFSRSIPSGILKCQSLVSIDLSSNQLNGTLPNGFGAAFPKLKNLNLAANDIDGRILDISGFNSILSLNISGNSFQGSIMGVFQEKLEVLDLSRNQFQGHISQVQYYNWSHLVYLDLSGNQLSGEIFQNLLSLSESLLNLKHLNLAHNRFSKQKFPTKIEKLQGLEYLNLSKTNLVGLIPDEISKLSNLNVLDLSMNHLAGKVPILRNKHLQILDLSNNTLSGTIPLSVLGKLPFMERYNFSYNNLTLCASDIHPDVLESAFFGSVNSCPIAADPHFFRRKNNGHNKGMKLALVLTFSMIFMLAGLLFLAFGCRRKSKMWQVKQTSYKEEQNISGPFSFQTDSTTWVADVKQATSVPVVIFEKPLLNITFADLLAATSNFDRGTLLAEGKFGPVYRGFLPGGIHVAVKVLVVGSTLTDQEVARELEFLGRIKHPNLVPLTGYCVAGDQRIAIYDYMENGNLQNLLYDLPLGVQSTDDWSTDTWDESDNNGIQNAGSEGLLTTWRFRHKIALGTARALAFLHHGCSPPIIHRAVKASSVYLDFDLEPRLSDFGLAKIFGSGLDEEIALGSSGYVPPEFSQQEFESPTTKSDVYCYGVVLFELVTGKKPVGDDYPDDKESTLVSWVRGLVRKNQASIAIDPKIRDTGLDEQMEEALKIGYLCTADLPAKRPTMQQIVGLLKDIEPIASN
ncbi:probable LRR receptor-like serine/threonine-protein kinase At2g24230 isoform X1 [Arachis ipaensis]|uniref:probable LRR receptor-like serine/threonine-protein kinase At2g24230 isoform X1 n=1 Tax=Arachis ipaensis TaxID=130454 RepID=UPI000A2B4A6A|nr:probable LRR receptor-like serine/threonine-protein kinase At2g24230 isoform X1 [Arachis ipaensis]XP_025630594.1 probable LRR receptor-like serine/threonine-protein kinase At2g24230 isoform X1 [Arachis hypogaea]QHO21765.1 putative LRR receptor-like serine/threonine-protein kinase [Arachis hypogaea]